MWRYAEQGQCDPCKNFAPHHSVEEHIHNAFACCHGNVVPDSEHEFYEKCNGKSFQVMETGGAMETLRQSAKASPSNSYTSRLWSQRRWSQWPVIGGFSRPPVGWHSKLSGHREDQYKMGSMLDNEARSAWEDNPSYLCIGTFVNMQLGMFRQRGGIMRCDIVH